jgi:hypothetical protein
MVLGSLRLPGTLQQDLHFLSLLAPIIKIKPAKLKKVTPSTLLISRGRITDRPVSGKQAHEKHIPSCNITFFDWPDSKGYKTLTKIKNITLFNL